MFFRFLLVSGLLHGSLTQLQVPGHWLQRWHRKGVVASGHFSWKPSSGVVRLVQGHHRLPGVRSGESLHRCWGSLRERAAAGLGFPEEEQEVWENSCLNILNILIWVFTHIH